MSEDGYDWNSDFRSSHKPTYRLSSNPMIFILLIDRFSLSNNGFNLSLIPYFLLFSYLHIVFTPHYSKCPVNRSILFVRWRIRLWSRFYLSPDFFQYRLSWPRSIKILFIFFVGIWILSYLAFLYFFRVACYLQVKIILCSE